MATTYICPSCGKAVTTEDCTSDSCPCCGAALPEGIAAELKRILIPKRPLMLTIQMYIGILFGFLLLLDASSTLSPDGAKQMEENYKLLDQTMAQMNMPLLPHMSPWVAGIVSLVKAIVLLWSSYTLYMNRHISRAALMILTFTFTIPEVALLAPGLSESAIGHMLFYTMAFVSMLVLFLAYLYLYKYKSVIAYYNYIAEQEAPREPEEAGRS